MTAVAYVMQVKNVTLSELMDVNKNSSTFTFRFPPHTNPSLLAEIPAFV